MVRSSQIHTRTNIYTRLLGTARNWIWQEVIFSIFHLLRTTNGTKINDTPLSLFSNRPDGCNFFFFSHLLISHIFFELLIVARKKIDEIRSFSSENKSSKMLSDPLKSKKENWKNAKLKTSKINLFPYFFACIGSIQHCWGRSYWNFDFGLRTTLPFAKSENGHS